MQEEQLFEMVNQAVTFAKEEIQEKQTLETFAMAVYRNGYIEQIKTEKESAQEQYDDLVEQLRYLTTETPKITGIAIVATVDIPALYKAPVSQGIRIHLEERHKSDTKIGGRFLYVPYQLYKKEGSEQLEAHLYNPIPVSIPQEIFTKA